MISNISTLTTWASFWDAVSVVSATFVLIGVIGESVADFDILARWTGLSSRTELRKNIAKVGLLVLITALAIEVVAAIGSHNTNADIITALNTELSSTIRQDLELTKLTRALGFSNNALEHELLSQHIQLSTIGARSTEFEQAIAAQKVRDDAALKGLKHEETQLVTARNEVLANAGRAASAADAASKAQADMNTALNAVQSMQQRMHEIITPRQIDDAHFAALVAALKPFAKTPVEFAMTRDNESGDLLIRVTDAATEANWAIQPWAGGGFGLNVGSRPDLPPIGEVTSRGVQINISESDREKFTKPVLAFANALLSAGIQVSSTAFADKMADGKPDPRAVKPGVVHIIVGAKP